MHRFHLLASLSCTFIFLMPLSALGWQTDYEKVEQISQKEHRPILLFFNGSDWSGHAMRMKHEVLDTAAFQEKIGQHFLCVEIDFPQHKVLPQALLKQNEELKKRFYVQEIPSLVLLDSQQRVIAQVGYLPENGEELAQDLIKILELDRELVSGLGELDRSVDQLQHFYSMAQELGDQEAILKILTKGLEIEEPFFLLEKYRQLVENGEREKAILLRNKMISLGTRAQETHFHLALIEFQQLSQSTTSPDRAIEPLTEYLLRYENIDQANVWRIEMMIAQHYMETEEKEKALLHAEKAFKTAPADMHHEIAHSLDYIRRSAIQ